MTPPKQQEYKLIAWVIMSCSLVLFSMPVGVY